MKSSTTAQFWKLYGKLPQKIRYRADRAYNLWRLNLYAPVLHYKRVGLRRPVYSVRIDKGYRSLGLRDEDTILWFWIGTHDEYERLLKYM